MPVFSTPGVPYTPGRTNFGLLPEPERSPASFFTSALINGLILLMAFYLGSQVKNLVEHKYEETVLIIPATPLPPPKLKMVEPATIQPPEPPKIEVKLEQPKIVMPKPEPKPEPKPIQMEAKVNMPVIKAAKPAVILAPQPKAAMTAAMPAQSTSVKPSTAPVHLGDTFGVTPNPNASRPATVASIGNPYGGMRGPAVAPHGVVGSTGIGNGLRSGSNAGVVGKVAQAGVPGATGTALPVNAAPVGHVASAGIPKAAEAVTMQQVPAAPTVTTLEVISKPPVQYTSEARQLRIQGDVVLKVTFTANGQVLVLGVMHGLGHGLDEEARRVAQLIRFHPATRNGQPVDATTTITVTFQLA
ncbi:MAG: TonB family protein [Terracidiphilus sp.]|nr:TonB family protein [Terracidiphilus sp.]